MITLRQYYFFAILLPIIVPAIPWSLAYLNIEFVNSNLVAFVVHIIMISTFVYVPQYIFFLVWAFLKYRKESNENIRRFSFKAPLYFLLFEVLGLLLVMIYNISEVTATDVTEASGILVFFASLAIVFGYSYVALAHSLAFILQKIGFIKPEPEAAGE